jgi:hypothetical protein
MLLAAVAVAGCDCSPPVVPLIPRIVVTPTRLDFPSLVVGTIEQLPVEIQNKGRGNLYISSVTLQNKGDISLPSILTTDCTGLARGTSATDELKTGACARVLVQFNATQAESLSNVLLIESNDPETPVVKVPITAEGTPAPRIQVCVLDSNDSLVPGQCSNLMASPPFIPTLDFGSVQDGQSAVRKIRVLSTGETSLTVSSLRVQASAPALALFMPPATPADLAVSTSVDVPVKFAPTVGGGVTGELVIHSDADGNPEVDVPITAVGKTNACRNPTARIAASVGSAGVAAVGVLQMTTVTFTAVSTGGSSRALNYVWTLISAPAGNTSMLVSSGATATLDCTLAGTYEVGVTVQDVDGCASEEATVSIPVMALPPTCGPSTQFIYLVDESGELYQFYPNTVRLTDLGPIGCQSAFSTVNTMAVDRQGIAWVEYQDASVYKVDTTNLTCYPTSFNPSSTPSGGWGSCFAADAAGSTNETYYIADSGSLYTINTTTMALGTVGAFTGFSGVMLNEPELTGTPSAELFGFFPGTPWVLGQIDKANATILSQVPLRVISNNISTPGNWAFASWGNDFWFFVGDGGSTDIFHFNATTATTTLATTTSAVIVGAGVSPCVQAQ